MGSVYHEKKFCEQEDEYLECSSDCSWESGHVKVSGFCSLTSHSSLTRFTALSMNSLSVRGLSVQLDITLSCELPSEGKCHH